MRSDKRGGKAEQRSGRAPARRSSARIGYTAELVGSVANPADAKGAPGDSLYNRLNRQVPLYREFHFRDGTATTGVSAANLGEFVDAIAAAAPTVLVHHARSGDFSRWLEDLSGNLALARVVRRIEDQLWHTNSADHLSRRRQELVALLAPLCVVPDNFAPRDDTSVRFAEEQDYRRGQSTP